MPSHTPLRKKLRPLRAGASAFMETVRYASRGKAHFGHCPICERGTFFAKHGEWLRDEYLCVRCHSIPRFRALIHTLGKSYPQWRDMRIFESSPGGASSDKIARECLRYTSAHFFPDVSPGKFKDGVLCENLEALTFADSSFDLVVTQDVFEHVFHPDAAFREIARVLAPGGAHLFTVPVTQPGETVVRAVEKNGQVEHLLPPEYHINPIDPQGSLVVRDWGSDLVDYIAASSGLKTEVFDLRNPKLGLEAEYLQVYLTQRR